MGELLVTLLVAGLVAALLAAILAPFESLTWWAGWIPGAEPAGADLAKEAGPAGPTRPLPNPLVVYLSGIGSISGEEILPEEIPFLDGIERLVPGGVLIRDVFPYSVTDTGLSGSTRFASTLWDLLGRVRLRGDALLGSIINARNAFQVAVSTDSRYGPIFNYGTAQTILRKAEQAGFRQGSGQRLTLIGYSGGGQVAVGAAAYLARWTGTEIDVVSLGGVMCSDPGIGSITHLTHFVGDRDGIESIGRIMFFGRWPAAKLSAWNRAKATGVVKIVPLPGMTHNVPGGYMDPNLHTPGGESYLDCTVRLLADAINRQLLAGLPPRPPHPG